MQKYEQNMDAVTGEPEIMIFGMIRLSDDSVDRFLPMFRAHAERSRQEPGNMAFDVFRPEDGSAMLLFVERWRDQAAIDSHMAEPSLAVIHGAMQELGAQPLPVSILRQMPPSGTPDRRAPASPSDSRNVLVSLRIKPEGEGAFLDAWRELVPYSRNAKGNAVLELYRDTEAPNHYFLFERWDDVARHEAVLAAAEVKAFEAVLADTLADQIEDGKNRFLARDVT